jgi:PAS domain S-box-containing protein
MSVPVKEATNVAGLDQTKALEVALQTSQKLEEQFRTLLATIPTLVWRTGSDGSAEFFNQRWYEYTGISLEDAQGSGWMTAFHPDDLEILSKRWIEIVASEQPSEVEARFRRYDGVYRWHLMRS